MNQLYLGGAGILAALVYALYRWATSMAAQASIQHTQDEDKSLQQQQTENEAKLAAVNKELAELYDEHQKLNVNEKTDEQKASTWNTPKS
jgi:hypothetical protein